MLFAIIYPFNVLNYFLTFMRHTVTIYISHLCVKKNTSEVVFSSRILIEYLEMMMSWYDDMIWWWYWLSYQRKSAFFFRKNVTVWYAKNNSQVVFSSRILIEYVEMTMSWYNDMIWWWYWLSYKWKSVFFQEKCDMLIFRKFLSKVW